MAEQRYENPGPMPLASTEKLDKMVAQRFLTPAERRSRVDAAALVCGFTSLANLARMMGMFPSVLYRSLGRENPPLKMILRMAVALDVSTEFLLEKKLSGKDEREQE